MQEGAEFGSHVFIIESNRTITEMIIAARRGDFYTLRFYNGGAIQFRKSRIFLLREDSEKKMTARVVEKRKFNSPYDYGN